MSTFAADWATAKTAFQTATNAKKPSATFLGVFSKGTRITSALKSADEAKTVRDSYKAMKAFKTAAMEYATTLQKAINDPKGVPDAQKPAYKAEAKKLLTALQEIFKTAQKTGDLIFPEKGKVSVNVAAKKQEAEDATKAKKQDAEDAEARKKLKEEHFDILGGSW